MARTDRLMRLMDLLRRLPAPVTAARLAEESGVSARQLYRDIATLRAGGALIDGAAGLGYTLTEDSALPPQSFSRLEIEALMLAVAQLDRIGDAGVAEAGRNALSRIVATLPERQAQQALHAVMRVFLNPAPPLPVRIDLDRLRRACWEEEAITIAYTDLQGRPSQREVLPLGLSYSDGTLLLLAWCLLRGDYRLFHVTRIEALSPGGGSFRPRRATLLRGYVARRAAACARAADEPQRRAGG